MTLAIAIILISISTIAGPVAAATTTITAAGNDTTASSQPSSSGIKLSLVPIYQERSPDATMTPINQTHGLLTFTGNGRAVSVILVPNNYSILPYAILNLFCSSSSTIPLHSNGNRDNHLLVRAFW